MQPEHPLPVNAIDKLKAHPASSIHAAMDPTPKGPVDYILVHKYPSWLLPVRNDKRTRTGADYQAYFANFTADAKARGVQQPVIAVTEGDAARVVDGETRRQAALLAGLDSIPILLYQRELSEAELTIAQLQANAQRRDFTPLELAAVYQELMRLNAWNQSQLARAIHVSPGHVAKVLAISTKLCDEVQEMVAAGKLQPRAAYALTRLADHARQIEIARRAVELPMSVETVEEIVEKELNSNKKLLKAKLTKFSMCGITGTIKGNPLEALKSLHAKIAEVLKRVERDPALMDVLPSLLKGG
jgi:ParB/RepB/Spo0J family partition protein